eukprot:TRINITY_DN3593_c0_g1_i1.p1 TRINITY_DN3593_c0_g1~~TRINITY_DN3593_c0_g1_i1.p1  ORF type:complete len:436 (-),score=-8.78 TRINITY_DN3593_c0_g1_i1:29-1336(-)
MGDKQCNVAYIAVFSRILIVTISIFFGLLVKDYDTVNSIVLYNSTLQNPNNYQDLWIKTHLGMLSNWDAVHFLKIAEVGYQYELSHTFFPGLPIIMRAVSIVLEFLIPSSIFLSKTSVLLISGVLVSNLCFIGAAVALYRLTINIFHDRRFASLTTTLFCFNPASIFMSAIYSESLFAFSIFSALWILSGRHPWKTYIASIFFAISAATRSNGVICAAFIAYYYLGQIIQEFQSNRKRLSNIVGYLANTFFCTFIIVLPQIIYYSYTYNLYCVNFEPIRPWCNEYPPLFYNFVQATYWGVGVFKYYNLKQLPNFLLASPILILSTIGTLTYLFQDLKFTMKLGFSSLQSRSLNPYYRTNIMVYIAHWFFILLFSYVVLHIQVATRFIASQCVPFYWFTASLYEYSGDYIRKFIAFYFCLYFLLGSLLYSNFHPWT